MESVAGQVWEGRCRSGSKVGPKLLPGTLGGDCSRMQVCLISYLRHAVIRIVCSPSHPFLKVSKCSFMPSHYKCISRQIILVPILPADATGDGCTTILIESFSYARPNLYNWSRRWMHKYSARILHQRLQLCCI